MSPASQRTTARDWVREPDPERGIHFADDADGWTHHTYPEIAGRAARLATALQAQGVASGDRVCVLLQPGIDYVAAIYGVWITGAAVTPVPPPMFEDREQYLDRVASIIDQTGCRITVTAPDLLELTQAAHDRAGQGRPWLYEEAPDEAAPSLVSELALVQFTSGSTGTPRGVQVSWNNLATTFDFVRGAAGWTLDQAGSSWLPLHHDLGFVGALLTAVSGQSDMYLMRPDQFIRDPLRWLKSLEHAQQTVAPPFALGYTARRVTVEQVEKLDLSGVRAIAVGAEPVRPRPLAAFIDLTAHAGMSSRAINPGYGAAENTLFITSGRAGQQVTALRVDPAKMRFGAPVEILETGTLDEPAGERSGGWLISSGIAIGEAVVEVVDEDLRPVADGVLGEVFTTGPSVALGYARGDNQDNPTFRGGGVATGDAGFKYNGGLFVLGRMGTSIKVRGRSVFVEELDQQAANAAGLSLGKLSVVAGERADETVVALFVEEAPGDWMVPARASLRAMLGPEPRIEIVSGERGLILRTSSGKPRRRAMWQLLQDGLVAAVPITDEEGT